MSYSPLRGATLLLLLLTATVAESNDTLNTTANSTPNATRNATGNATCKNSRDPMKPCPGSQMKITGLLTWASFTFAMMLYWLGFAVTQAKKKKLYVVPAIICMFLQFSETTYSLCDVIYSSQQYPWVKYPWATMVKMMVGGTALWVLNFIIGDIGFCRLDRGALLKRFLLAFSCTTMLSLIAMVLVFTGNAIFSIAVFLLVFEPPQFFLLANAWGAAYSFKKHCNSAFIFAVGFTTVFGMHFASVAKEDIKDGLTSSFVYYSVQIIGTLILSVGLTMMMCDGTFYVKVTNGILEKIGFDKDKSADERERRVAEGVETHLISPEYIFAVGVPFTLFGYAVSGFCLFVWSNFDMKTDPVFHLYGTLHPCILLDYLPGTIFAQIFMGIAIVLQDFAVLAAVFRAAFFGDALFVGLNAFALGLFWVFNSIYVLVFTFNPTVTNVFMHSLPYMIMNVNNSFFLFAMCIIMCKWPALNLKRYSLTTAIYYILAAGIYGTYFMSDKLMSDAGMNLLSNRSQAEQDLLNKQPNFDPAPVVFAIMGQASLMSYGVLSPLRHRPLAFELQTRSNKGGTVRKRMQAYTAALNESAASNVGYMRLKVKTPLAMGRLSLILVYVFATVFDARIWKSDPDMQDYRKKFRRLPGAAIAAVGWVFVAHFFFAHVVLVAIYEMKTDSKMMSYVTSVIGVLLVVGMTAAIAGTIPERKDGTSTDWFKGLEFFVIMWGIWLLTAVARLCKFIFSGSDHDDSADRGQDDQDEEEITICGKLCVIIELVLGGLAVVASFVVPFSNSPKVDMVWMVVSALFAFLDSKGEEVTLTGMRIASPTDLMVEDDNGEWELPQEVIDTYDPDEYDETGENVNFQVVGKELAEFDDDDSETDEDVAYTPMRQLAA